MEEIQQVWGTVSHEFKELYATSKSIPLGALLFFVLIVFYLTREDDPVVDDQEDNPSKF